MPKEKIDFIENIIGEKIKLNRRSKRDERCYDEQGQLTSVTVCGLMLNISEKPKNYWSFAVQDLIKNHGVKRKEICLKDNSITYFVIDSRYADEKDCLGTLFVFNGSFSDADKINVLDDLAYVIKNSNTHSYYSFYDNSGKNYISQEIIKEIAEECIGDHDYDVDDYGD